MYLANSQFTPKQTVYDITLYHILKIYTSMISMKKPSVREGF